MYQFIIAAAPVAIASMATVSDLNFATR